MSKEERRVPELRFKGFFEDWEQRKFKNIVDRVSISSEDESLPRLEYEDILSSQGRLNKDIYTKDSEKKGIEFKPNDILFGKLRPYLNKWLNPRFKGIAVGDFWVLRSREIESKFVYYLIQTAKFKSISNISTGTKMPRADWKIVSNSNFFVPQEYHDGKKISEFISYLENAMSLHQRKINMLEKLKQEYFRSLFATQRKNIPKIRFGNFSVNWEIHKLEHFMSERTERSENGELISVTIDSGVVRASSLKRKDNSSKDKSNYKVVKAGDIPYNSMRMWQGASGLSLYNGILSPAYTVLIPRENSSGLFFFYLFKTNLMLYQFKKFSQGLTSDTWNLKFPLLKSIKVKVPNIEEQQVIGGFLKNLDEVIIDHRKKVDKLLTIKKSYLKKMFI